MIVVDQDVVAVRTHVLMIVLHRVKDVMRHQVVQNNFFGRRDLNGF